MLVVVGEDRIVTPECPRDEARLQRSAGESCCLREAGRGICSWGGLDDVSSYDPGDDRVSCRRGTAKPGGPEYPQRDCMVT